MSTFFTMQACINRLNFLLPSFPLSLLIRSLSQNVHFFALSIAKSKVSLNQTGHSVRGIKLATMSVNNSQAIVSHRHSPAVTSICISSSIHLVINKTIRFTLTILNRPRTDPSTFIINMSLWNMHINSSKYHSVIVVFYWIR